MALTVKENSDRIVSYDRRRIKEEMRILIDQSVQSTTSTLFLPTDGLSGSGKTACVEMLQNLAEQISGEIHFVMVPVDMFLATDRGSPARASMTKFDSSHYWRTIYRRDILKHIIVEAAELGEREGTIAVPQRYNRASGQVESGNFVIELPAGKKLLAVEGIDAISILAEANPNGNSEILNILKHARPEEAMKRVISRGVPRGSGSEEHLRQQYSGEYRFQIPRINKSNAKTAQLVLHDR